jgi:site-specific recombinase XerD
MEHVTSNETVFCVNRFQMKVQKKRLLPKVHKYKKLPRKAYPISYKEVSLLIQHTMAGVSFENLSFVKLHFVTFLVTLYSSFARYEEVVKLNFSDVLREETGFVFHFKKGKSYH